MISLVLVVNVIATDFLAKNVFVKKAIKVFEEVLRSKSGDVTYLGILLNNFLWCGAKEHVKIQYSTDSPVGQRWRWL